MVVPGDEKLYVLRSEVWFYLQTCEALGRDSYDKHF